MAQKRLCVGLLAHVDAGKTTLAEALLYLAGTVRKPGRVDRGDTALDTHALERERGITIFAGEGRLSLPDAELTLLDTPGHVDFSAETERVLRVLDYAVLVISGADGVQSHTETLWRLLALYGVPTVLFVTKMDLARRTREDLLAELRRELSEGCVGQLAPDRQEQISLCGEDLLETYLETGTLTPEQERTAVLERRVFPVFFGSGLRLDGVEDLLTWLRTETVAPPCPAAFGARVFKISYDPAGTRLTHLKVTGGRLAVRDPLMIGGKEEKVPQLRCYLGSRFRTVDEALPGDVCVIPNLVGTAPGMGLGFEAAAGAAVTEPVMHFALRLPKDADVQAVLPKLRQLEEEDPQLRLTWDERLRELRVSLMGRIQAEILRSLIRERFGLDVEIGNGRVRYRETIETAVEGVGHYEPLRHYAEVHLLLEPLPRGSGLRFASTCPEDRLDRNWQRLILTHLAEKEHLGVLTGSPLTDVKITLAAGRAHLKHTEGGDFRQATYRAVRQGLMQAKSVLLEPWYRVWLAVPPEKIGRAITDLRARSGDLDAPTETGDLTVLTGRAPVASMQDYAAELAAYTGGRGRLRLEPDGYAPCHNAAEAIAAAAYDPERDLDNPPDSVFCAHGGGFTVKWDRVKDYMHLESVLRPEPGAVLYQRRRPIDDRELEAILRREFGDLKTELRKPLPRTVFSEPTEVSAAQKQVVIVDGYNVIFAWDDLGSLAQTDLDRARTALLDDLAAYRAVTEADVAVVFDAYRVPGGRGERLDWHGVRVAYTKENETGDLYIEKLVQKIGKNVRVRVVTSDALIQLSSLRSGVLRQSAAEFGREVDEALAQIDAYLKTHRPDRTTVGELLETKK